MPCKVPIKNEEVSSSFVPAQGIAELILGLEKCQI